MHLYKILNDHLGNPSSSHRYGVRAASVLENSRQKLALKLSCSPNELIFCSGGTEANNWIIRSMVSDWQETQFAKSSRPHVITCSTDHSSTRLTAKSLFELGLIDWSEASVDSNGFILIKAFEGLFKSTTTLVSIAHGNNETGTIQNLSQIGTICERHGVHLHIDASQSFCHTEFNFHNLPIHFATISGHKIRAPKGIGALIIKKGVALAPLLTGGGHEHGLRSGTPSVELASSLATAAEEWTPSSVDTIQTIKSFALRTIKEVFPGAIINGTEDPYYSLPHILSFTLPPKNSRLLHQKLSEAGVYCSTGAACRSGQIGASFVLKAMGRPDSIAHQLRFSFSTNTTQNEIELAFKRLKIILTDEIL